MPQGDIESVGREEHIEILRVPIEYSAYCAVQEPEAGVRADTDLLLAMHGYGQSCKGFINHFEHWRGRNVLAAVAQGANQFYWDRGKVGFTWMTSYMREYTIRDNLRYLTRLVFELRERYGCEGGRLFLMGFSQGVATAFRLAGQPQLDIAGLIACGGDLPPDVEEELREYPRFPVYVVHGKQDDSMSFERMAEDADVLERHGFEVVRDYFEGGHDIPEPQRANIFQWLESQGVKNG